MNLSILSLILSLFALVFSLSKFDSNELKKEVNNSMAKSKYIENIVKIFEKLLKWKTK